MSKINFNYPHNCPLFFFYMKLVIIIQNHDHEKYRKFKISIEKAKFNRRASEKCHRFINLTYFQEIVDD